MRQRATATAVALGLAVAGLACSHPESNVVDQYFTALRANDTNTLTSFAMVAFDKKVDNWKVVTIGPETRTPATLPDLVKKQKQIEADLAENLKEFRAWGNDLEVYPKLDKVKDLRKDDKKIPGNLQAVAEKYDAYNEKDRSLKKQLAEAKDAVARERRNTQLSIGTQFEDTMDQMTGEVVSKDIDLNLTIDGQVKPYVMVLRKYDLQTEGGGPRMVSRWVVQSLEPKG
jgi:hypothetical protein